MKYGVYANYVASEDFSTFEFISTGAKGAIRKLILFLPTELEEVYNLAFGDVGENSAIIDDQAVTDNGDCNKVLATIVAVVDAYTSRYPDRWVYFSGSTEERTRLYRMAIGLNFEELVIRFWIYAEAADDQGFVPFEKNMKVAGFLIKRKND